MLKRLLALNIMIFCPAVMHAALTMNNFSIYAGSGMSTGNNVSVNGNVGSGGNIYLGNNAGVDGNILAKGSFGAGNGANIDGSINFGTTMWVPGSVQITGSSSQNSSWSMTEPTKPGFVHNSSSDYYKRSSVITLNPGVYGSLSVSRDSTVYLSAGTYNFSDIWLDRNVKVIADTSAGDIRILSSNKFSTGDDVNWTTIGSGQSVVVSNKDLWIGKKSFFDASLESFAGVSAGINSEITGRIYASESVWLGNNVKAGTAVPEPASILLLLAALPYINNKVRRVAAANSLADGDGARI